MYLIIDKMRGVWYLPSTWFEIFADSDVRRITPYFGRPHDEEGLDTIVYCLVQKSGLIRMANCIGPTKRRAIQALRSETPRTYFDNLFVDSESSQD